VQAEGIKIQTNRWTDAAQTIDVLLPGDSRQLTFKVNLPSNTQYSDLDVQAFYKNTLVTSKKIAVNLLVPKNAVKLVQSEDGIYPTIVFDNRNEHRRRITVEYSLEKDGETYLIDTLDNIEATENEVYYTTLSSTLTTLPEGTYTLKAKFYERGQVIGEQVEVVDIAGKEGGVNVRLLFYIIAAVLVGAFMYLVLLYKPRRGE